MSDRLCAEHGLSVIAEEQAKSVSYDVWEDNQKGVDWKVVITEDMATAIKQAKTLQGFKAELEKMGYTVKGKARLSVKHPNRDRFMRTDRANNNFTLENIQEWIKNGGTILPKKKRVDLLGNSKVEMLVALEGKTGGLKKWAEKYNLQQLTKAYNYLQKHGLADYGELQAKLVAAENAFSVCGDSIKALENKIDSTKALRVHITNYAKTREVYKAYQSSRHKEKFYNQHSAQILVHEAARQVFKNLNLRKLPRVVELTADLETLQDKKAELYSQYKTAKAELRELQAVKQGMDAVLGEKGQVKKEQERTV